jgi:cell division septal protein FtsQ
VARWNDNAFLNAYGEIFVPQPMIELSRNLPRFFGQQDQTVKMLDNYQQMNNILNSLKLQIKTLTYNNDHSWQIQLNNGISLQLGQQYVLERLTRFVKTYKKILLTHRNMVPKKVDLRYSHGLAVDFSG